MGAKANTLHNSGYNKFGGYMEFLKIILLSAASFAVLFILTRLMGYRTISELSFFDYVIGISIGSIAAEMATNADLELYKGITAMVVYALFSIAFQLIQLKSSHARKFISGQPIIIIEKGKIIRKNMKKARIELDDLISFARAAGYFNLSDIDFAVMENTGKISFMPTALKRELNPKDFNFAPKAQGIPVNVIMDGKIMEGELARANLTKKDLIRRVRQQNREVKDVLLASVDLNGVLTLFEK